MTRTRRRTKGRFMGSLHDFKITHWDHEPATDRSADSLVREFLGLDSCGHGCPRSDSGSWVASTSKDWT